MKVSGVKKWLLAVAIAIVFAMFVNYGVSTFYKAPEFKDFSPDDCPEGRYPLPMEEKETYRAECDEWANEEFRAVEDRYETNVFIALVILGVMGLILGVLLKLEAVSTGLLLGGLMTLLFATMRYWARLFDYARFIILGVVLVILIWIGYKKLK